MKAYNTPKDELLIKSDEGEELVKITPEKTTIANLEGGGSGGSGNTIVMYADANAVQDCISDPTQSFSLYTNIELSSGYESLDEIPADGYFVCKPVMSGQVMATVYPIGFSGGRYVSYIFANQNQDIVVVRGVLNQPGLDQ